MKSISTINFEEKRVLVRVDFNVPLDEEGNITDDSRMKACIPTIKTIMDNGGRPILMSHLGRPKGQRNLDLSLNYLTKHLEDLTGKEVVFMEDCIGEDVVDATETMGKNQILLLENLRFYKEETDGDENFAKSLSLNGDFYVNDAFGTAHRAHASTAVIAKFFKENKAPGLVMSAEIENVNKVLNERKSPVTAIVGGAKVSSKIDILSNLIPKLDNLIIGGGMAFTFIKANGGMIGKSLVENDYLDTAINILKKADEYDVDVYLPIDSVNADAFSNDAKRSISLANEIAENDMGLDAGPKTLEELKDVLQQSKTILWNGPMGVFEFENFSQGTEAIGNMIVEATKNGAFSLVGGGDSVAAVKKFNIQDEVSYVSTGGGAMLEYLEGKELPGIKALSEG
tara:strand:- start:42589 stop:43782 length:1194 start_codon:yes stop_codon:yes gene_type:complete